MKMNHHIWAILLLCFLGIACTRVETHNLTKDELAFVDYEVGDEFKLKSQQTGDTIVFRISSITDRYHEVYPSRWKKDELRMVYLIYRSYHVDTPCGGVMYVTKESGDGPPYKTSFYFDLRFSCIEQSWARIKVIGHDAYQYPVSLTIDSTLYRSLYYFEHDSAAVYYSKEKGYIKAENTVTGDVFTFVE